MGQGSGPRNTAPPPDDSGSEAAPRCYRCGQPGEVDWVNIRTFGEPEPTRLMGGAYCATEGCTDLDGSRRLEPLTPAQLRRRADDMWLAKQRALAQAT